MRPGPIRTRRSQKFSSRKKDSQTGCNGAVVLEESAVPFDAVSGLVELFVIAEGRFPV